MSLIRNFLKSIPGVKNFFLNYIAPLMRSIRIACLYHYDWQRFVKYCGHKESREALLSDIIMTYHVLEKGLTMPEMRLGFGKENLLGLIEKLNKYADLYGSNDEQFRYGVSVIAEYKKTHEGLGFLLDSNVITSMNKLLERFNVSPSQQIETTREKFYASLSAPFPEFSASRHSVRNFSGSISIEQIKNAVAIASNAPSACNRQPCKIHLVSEKLLIEKCLAFQNGNRGFGNLTDKLLIITADIRASFESEPLDVRTNAGIFIMNVCYALHANKVAHCLLNWFVSPSKDKSLRSLLNLHPAETIVVFIACGDVPEEFKLAGSPKKSVDEILVCH